MPIAVASGCDHDRAKTEKDGDMIFARRALQRRLNELRPVLGAGPTKKLADRLNRPGRDRMAAIWEVVVLHGLSTLGSLESETPLLSGRRPDIGFFSADIAFTADVTSVSDDGLDAENPVSELMMEVEAAKTRLGLAIGGMDLRVQSRSHVKPRGTRTVLRLPRRERVREFVRDKIEPMLREQIAAGDMVMDLALEDEHVGIEITIDPRKSPYNSGAYAAYNTPTIRDQNPLYKALKGKAEQLRSAQGIKGIIVGDAGSRCLADPGFNASGLSARAITSELLRQYSSIDFILLLSVRDEQRSWFSVGRPERKLRALLEVRKDYPKASAFDALFREMMAQLPSPVMMPVNGALRASEAGYDLGHHGGYGMEGSKVRIGARELAEILAGRRSILDDGIKFPERRTDKPRPPNLVQAVFDRKLREGRLPRSITVLHTGEDDSDDWIEFEFGDPDPAISLLK